jgi:hypothetical protein
MSARKAGRPTQADLEERKRRRANAAEEDRHREEMEAKIAQGRVKLISWAEYITGDIDDDDPDLLIAMDTLPPALYPPRLHFLHHKLKDVPIERFEEAMLRALRDLFVSDVPLDPEERRWVVQSIAGVEASLDSTPKLRRLSEARARLQVVEWWRSDLIRRGFTVPQADDEIARGFGWKDGKTLKRIVRRIRKRLREAPK